MAELLYLVHRMPYPPNKGDKVRSYHLLKHLAERHRIYLGTFVDDPADWQHLNVLRDMCADVLALPIHPRRRRIASLAALASGQALSLRYYDDARLHHWVARTLQQAEITAAVVFSSSMAPYALRHAQLPMLLDMVDVDSAKWSAYADAHRGPMAWLYRREGQKLLAFERAAACRSARTFLVTEKEQTLFRGLAPETANHLEVSCNGVDAVAFAPDVRRPSPFGQDERPIVFTGAMDYWPNVDAVCWFVQTMLPRLRQRWPQVRLHIVGRSPTPAVHALAGEAVHVTGTVPDVRPYLQHAAVVIAPLRLARGVQNKVLEAMAMGRPVVAARSCVEAIDAVAGQDILDAETEDDYLAQLDSVLAAPVLGEQVGAAGRRCVLANYSWPARLSGIDTALATLPGQASATLGAMPQWEPA